MLIPSFRRMHLSSTYVPVFISRYTPISVAQTSWESWRATETLIVADTARTIAQIVRYNSTSKLPLAHLHWIAGGGTAHHGTSSAAMQSRCVYTPGTGGKKIMDNSGLQTFSVQQSSIPLTAVLCSRELYSWLFLCSYHNRSLHSTPGPSKTKVVCTLMQDILRCEKLSFWALFERKHVASHKKNKARTKRSSIYGECSRSIIIMG